MKKETKKKYDVKLKLSEYNNICSFGGGSFTQGIYVLLEIANKENKTSVRKEENVRTQMKQQNIEELKTITQGDFGKDEIKDEKPKPTAQQIQKIREINKLTDNGTKFHYEDGEEYSKSDLLRKFNLLQFI